jgi:hypothetical protein
MGIPTSSFPLLEIILEVAVRSREGSELCQSPFSEDGSAEIGVNDNTGGVDKRLQARLIQQNQLPSHEGSDPFEAQHGRFFESARPDVLADPFQNLMNCLEHKAARVVGQDLLKKRAVEKTVNGRDFLK